MANKNLEVIFTQETIATLTFMLLNSFLPLRPSDLEAWERDPEQWALETLGEVGGADSGLSVHHAMISVNLDGGELAFLCPCIEIH
jgi:hypothetical protein